MSSRRGPPRPPLNTSTSSQVSSHLQLEEVVHVLNTITKILAASAEIIRKDERGNSCLPTATLDRISDFSESLREEVMSLPLSTISPLHKSLTIYELILLDIQRILSSSDPVETVEVSQADDTIDRRLDDFLLQFQEALDFLKGRQRSSPNLTHSGFFPNSHHMIISGGIFNATNNNISNWNLNPVVHDPVAREQSHKILQVIYIQCVVLFA